MQYYKTYILSLFLCFISLNSTNAQTTVAGTVSQHSADSIDLDLLEIVDDSLTIEYNIPFSALYPESITDDNQIPFDIPESMTTNIDSLLNNWYARNLLESLDIDNTFEPQQMSDSLYISRLESLPTIIQMNYNPVIRQYIERYITRNRTLVAYMVGMSQYYMPMIETALDEYNLPQELKYLPIIESALNPIAVSRANAKGLWQFMFQTGRIYGLDSNNYVDERFDPHKSTYAAVKYLKDLYQLFHDWNLAIAAYNCGPGNIKKAIMRSGGKTDFWQIYSFLPRETRGYIPAFIAANYIMSYYQEHGITPMHPSIPIATDTIHINKNIHFGQVADLCRINVEEIRALNPQYTRDILPGNSNKCVLRLPHEAITDFLTHEDSIYKYKEEVYFPEINRGSTQQNLTLANNSKSSTKHKIKQGESLGAIARKYRVTVKQLMAWNGLKNANIRAGRYLNIY